MRHRGRGRQPLPRSERRHRRELDGHCHPEVVAAIEAQGHILHYCSSDFYLPVYGELCERLLARRQLTALPPGRSSPTRAPRRSKVSIGPVPPAPARRGLLGCVPGRTLGFAVAHGQQGPVSDRLRPAAPGRATRAYGLAGLAQLETQFFKHPQPRGGRGLSRRALPGRGGHIPAPPGSSRGCARSAMSTASARGRRDPEWCRSHWRF